MSVPLGRFLGTEVRAHWSWVIILAFVTAVFAIDLGNPSSPPAGWSSTWAWGTAIATSALVFISVTVHELSHVAIAYRNGMKSPSVVIQLIGGAFAMEVRPKTAGQEFRVAVAGSAMSFFLAAVFGGFTVFLTYGPIQVDNAPLALQSFQFVAFMISLFNLFLGAINLLPGYPLDGARVSHAVVWQKTGDEGRATVAAIKLGRYVGYALIGTGILVALSADPITGLCLGIGGWLLTGSSRVLDRRAFLEALVAGLKVSDAVDGDVGRIPPQMTLDVFAIDYLTERSGSAALVERGGEVVGMIGTAQIRRIPRQQWTEIHTETVMVPIASVPTAAGDSPLWPALEVLERAGLDALLVPAEGEEPGVMTRRATAKLVHDRAEEKQRQLVAAGIIKKGRFGGR